MAAIQSAETPFEPTVLSCQQSGRRAPSGPRPAMTRPRLGANRCRAVHQLKQCDAAASALKKSEGAVAASFVSGLLEDCVDEEVSFSHEVFMECDSDFDNFDGEEDFDDVQSLVCDDGEESDEDVELEALQVVGLATGFARNVVQQGIVLDIKDAEAEEERRTLMAADFEEPELPVFSEPEFEEEEESEDYDPYDAYDPDDDFPIVGDFCGDEMDISEFVKDFGVKLQEKVDEAVKASEVAERPFHLQPSVGTWLLPPSFKVADQAVAAVEERAEVEVETAEVTESCEWNLQPSVGTWMLPIQRFTPIKAEKSVPAPLELPVRTKVSAEAERPLSPSVKTPSRSRRRIIGGVVRTSAESPEVDSKSLPTAQSEKPKTMAGSPAASIRRRMKESASTGSLITFKIDAAEDSGCENGGLHRKTSITQMFESLGGAEMFRMDMGDGEDHWSNAWTSQLPKVQAPFVAGRTMNRSASAATMTSAMAMDLGSPRADTSRAATPSMSSRSLSVGALKASVKMTGDFTSSKKASLLPMLTKPNSASDWSVSHAVNMNMGSTRAWSTTSISPVF
eukprot:TRINITY_DN108959_c0_g1_i1.p1 TRINITY_DN108959_c0_g1~~TRINITY_DN108959_c0_g1_i1.p1  ORF type:complete len:566 (-),score=156.07 TRINITY_DN108959_c0_g1_i1:298-1995(-)